MKMYIGDFWVPFPSSEYGGMWIAIANDSAQCVELLKTVTRWGDEFDDLIPNAVTSARQFEVPEETEARIVETFFT